MSLPRQRIRSKSRRVHTAAALLGLALAAPFASAIEVPDLQHMSEHFGRYAPAGDCQRQPQIVVARTGLSFENGDARHKVARIDYAASYGGNFYEGISQWLFPLYGNERPFLMTFNAEEQRGLLTLTPHDRGWQGGPPFSARHQALVDASPYRMCK